MFTDLDYNFQKGEFGEIDLHLLTQSTYKKHNNLNFIVQRFISTNGSKINSQWNSFYKNIPPTHKGLFVFIKSHPAKYKRFAFSSWTELKDLLPKKFASFIHSFEQNNIKKFKGVIIPIFIRSEERRVGKECRSRCSPYH